MLATVCFLLLLWLDEKHPECCVSENHAKYTLQQTFIDSRHQQMMMMILLERGIITSAAKECSNGIWDVWIRNTKVE